MDNEKKRCPNGERKDPKTGICVKMSEELIRHKQSLRNKKKGVLPTMNEQNQNATVAAVIAASESEKRKTKKRRPKPTLAVIPEENPTENIPPEENENIPPEENPTENVEPKDEEPEEKPSVGNPTEDVVKKTSNKNDFLFQKEKAEYDALKKSENSDSNDLYPTLDDPNFNYKISKRKEFSDTKYDGEIHDIREQSNLLCNAKFELMPHQLFVRNFLSFQTPYNSLLLYNGLGTGKTCSAIGIAEEMRAYMKQIGFTKKIIVIASPNVQDNFRLQLFDERKLELLPDGQWNLDTCIGNALLDEINPTHLKGLTKERIVSQIKSIINNYYVFMGDKGEFANYIKKKIFVPEDAGYSDSEKTLLRDKKIKAHFNNRLVIIDEIHNMRISDSNRNKMTSVLLNEIAKKSNNMRLLLLSATPMYNSYNEIIWLTNLLNANDKRATIKIEDVFNADGTFVEEKKERNKVVKEGGKDLLMRKLSGYVSYVRGENPYVFPYRVYPTVFDSDKSLNLDDYPTVQMNQLEIAEPLQYIPIYKNGIGEYQKEGYEFIMAYLGLKSNNITDKRGKTKLMPSFENMESFGYTLLLAPLESLIIVYPNPKLDEMIEKKQRLLDNVAESASSSTDEETPTEKSLEESYNQEENKEIIKSVIGKTGLSNIMKHKTILDPVPARFDFEYKPKIKEKYGEVFSPENLYKYSAKISNICEILQKPSKGIVLIYSQYIDGGVIPMALALESMGFSRYSSTPAHNRPLLKHKKDPIDSVTMKTRAELRSLAADPNDFNPARYVIITGDKDFSQNNDEDIKYVTSKENKNGERVKVIIISKAASEGLDFKNIRQVHILEPWYNMNRIEQIIGRGVRSLSHCGLPFEERNVEIYLHGTLLDKNEEAADLYVYRSAEKKAVQIGRVTRLLKEVAVDCHLNIAQTNFTEEKLLEVVANQNIKINVSSGKTVDFKIGDKPYTDICDYMDNCSFQCAKTRHMAEIAEISNTYEEHFVKNNSTMIMKKIRDLFLERNVYKREHLISAINHIKKYPIEHIFYALTRFINNKTEELKDKYGRSGYLVSKGEYYAFQPNEITDETISTFERNIPVDYKNTSLKMELPKTIAVQRTQQETEIEPEIPPENENPQVNETGKTKQNIQSVGPKYTYTEVLTQIKHIMKLITQKDIHIKASERNWYKHANLVVSELMTVHEMPEDLINKYIIFHFLDTLSLETKKTVVSKIYSANEPIQKNGYETIIQMYFDELVLEVENQRAIVLTDGDTNTLFVQNSENPDSWEKAKYTDIKLFEGSRKLKLMVPIERVNKTEIGFIHPFKGKEMVFKIKDMTQKRNNKGAKCEDASKPVIAEKIGIVLQEKDIYKSTTIERPDLCVILEILMRWITEKNSVREPAGSVLFFNPEMSIENNVINLKIV